ncbi:cell division protein FtsW [Celerinatantimonas diazotrophica]|uniref:Probable peptidoglycan glycosyltransferase FtsW n=1 Tax=Celerinatantimonas diazotrophica TaxID=412034 RepID=A0A4R1K2N9_9GAMM|nr:cell division protein FtsW [Celerinatantimonas diazotrophica]TCK57963.1 cell division-specific peptidoglycan biosynthesis regulator FtsW [Celerinatantimonas diazotrophica]CAG9297968.1 putative peptidoglycan glycosyltransferase FtsW [Celerinatantimonas diazotrophica]
MQLRLTPKLQRPWRWIREPQAPETGRLYDRQLLLLSIALLCLGLVMVASASIAESMASHHSAFLFVKHHAVYVVICLIAMAVVVQCPVELWKQHNAKFLLATMAGLLLVLIIGHDINGSKRWIGFGPLNVQPAEFAKLALFVYLAGYLVRRNQEIRESIKGFLKPLVVLCVLAVMILAQPDLGTVIVMFVATIGMLFIAGAKLVQFIGLMFSGIVAVVILIAAEPYRMERVTSFLNPWKDPFGSGYQLTQSLMAFGRGQWFGVGLGNSVLKLEYLPEAHTDFVMAILAEELGFVGVCIVLALFAWLSYKAIAIGQRALKSNQPFEGYLASGIGFWIAFQSAVNIGAASGMMPTKGLTLPLVSYGGSSLLVMSIAIGLLLRIDYEWRQANQQAYRREGE